MKLSSRGMGVEGIVKYAGHIVGLPGNTGTQPGTCDHTLVMV